MENLQKIKIAKKRFYISTRVLFFSTSLQAFGLTTSVPPPHSRSLLEETVTLYNKNRTHALKHEAIVSSTSANDLQYLKAQLILNENSLSKALVLKNNLVVISDKAFHVSLESKAIEVKGIFVKWEKEKGVKSFLGEFQKANNVELSLWRILENIILPKAEAAAGAIIGIGFLVLLMFGGWATREERSSPAVNTQVSH